MNRHDDYQTRLVLAASRTAAVDTGLHRWHRITPGNSLLVHVGPNGTRTFHEMPGAAANAVVAADPQHTLIIATWGGGAA